MTFWKRLQTALALGYILFFFSELVFWSFWKEGDSVIEYGASWLVYSTITYMLLLLIPQFHVRSIPALMLLGAAFGWLAEGLLAMTLFGVAELPLPYTLVWTSLAWHAILSLLFGWIFIMQSLAKSIRSTIGACALFGLFWGTWAIIWANETPPLITSGFSFFIFACITSALFFLAHWWMFKLYPAPFLPTKAEKIVLLLIALSYFFFVNIPIVGIPAVLLPILAILLYFPLQKNARTEKNPDILLAYPSLLPRSRFVIGLLTLSLTATATYLLFFPMHTALPLSQIFLVLTSLIGLGAFLWSIVAVYRRK